MYSLGVGTLAAGILFKQVLWSFENVIVGMENILIT